MTVVSLSDRLRRLSNVREEPADAEKRRRADAALIRNMSDMVEEGRLRAVSLEFDSSDGEVDLMILKLRSTS